MKETTRRNTIKMRWSVLAGAIVGIIACALFVTLPAHAAQEVTFSSNRDCDNNAVIECGALTATELQQKYNASPSAQAIYTYFNISPADISNLTSTSANCENFNTASNPANGVCAGTVTKSGTVLINGQIVAINAMTAGRQNMPGSTQETAGNTTFYTRPPSVSFVSDNLDAFVVMNNGQFQYAILSSCGNPVRATPTTKAPPAPPVPQPTTPTPQPTPPAPAPQVQQQQQSQTVVVQPAVSTQQSQPAPTPVATTTPQTLPNTGPGAIVGLFAGATTLGTLGARFFLKRRLQS